MKAIVAGGRDFVATREDEIWLRNIVDTLGVTEIVSGTARGADRFGEKIAQLEGIPIKRFPARWEQFGKGAGFKRNIEMAKYADALIVFPGGNGTAHMRRIAEEWGLDVIPRYK